MRTLQLHPKQGLLRALILLGALLLFGSIPQLPNMTQQGRDSGIFAYTGQVILEGGLPYVDAWDNKPPGVYYINALAFLVMGSNRWALWSIELLFNALTAGLLLALLLRITGKLKPAVAGTAIFVLLMRHPAFVGDGNFTESYALLPQVAGLATGYHFLTRPNARSAFWFGAAGALAFLIKPTTIGITVAFVPALILTRHPMLWRREVYGWLTMMLLGGLAVLGAVSAYLLAEGIFEEAYRAVIISPAKLHNWISRERVAPWQTVITTLRRGEGFHFTLLPLLPFALIGVTIGILARGRLETRHARRSLFFWTGLAFMLDLAMANLSNRGYYHYYQTPLPAGLLLGIMLVITSDGRMRRRAWIYLSIIGVAASIAILGKIIISPGTPIGEELEDPLAVYIETHTEPEDEVLVWGASTDINFQAERESPTQFNYGYPLIVPDYTTQEDIDEVVRDLERTRPVMIVDRAYTDGNRVPPLDPGQRLMWWAAQDGRFDTFDLTPIFDFVDTHCIIDEVIGEDVIFVCDYPPDPRQ
jgi:4-amino-4-deoxy-L-arabinose transferase-like glycosyltransferase